MLKGAAFGLEVEIQTDDQDELQSSGSKASHHMSSHVITVYACAFFDHQPVNIISTCQSERIKWRASKQSLRLGSFSCVTLLIGSLVAVKEHAKSMCYAATLTESHKSDS